MGYKHETAEGASTTMGRRGNAPLKKLLKNLVWNGAREREREREALKWQAILLTYTLEVVGRVFPCSLNQFLPVGKFFISRELSSL